MKVSKNKKNGRRIDIKKVMKATHSKKIVDISRVYGRRKQRGQRRKLNSLLRNIDRFIPFITDDNTMEHFHVPTGQWINSPKTFGKVKTIFIKKWLEKTVEFIKNKPNNLPFCKIVALIDNGDLWSSEIIIFYSEDYYKNFWDRKDKYQTWTLINDNNHSLAKIRNLNVDMKEKGYNETQFIEGNEEFNDEIIKSELWFYGEL